MVLRAAFALGVLSLCAAACGEVKGGADAGEAPVIDASEADADVADAVVADASETTIDAIEVDALPADAGVDATIIDARPPPPDATLTWGPLEAVSIAFSGSVMVPNVGSDGRTLYFPNQGPPPGQRQTLYVATRDTANGGFGAPAPVPNVATASVEQRFPEVSHDGLELYFTDETSGMNIYTATRSSTSATFSVPRTVGAQGNYASISGDKKSLYFLAHVGGGVAALRRISRAAVGQPWSTPQAVTVPARLDLYGGVDISRDELSILVGPTYTGTGSANDIYKCTRSSRSENFQTCTVVASKVDGTSYNSARWNGDETEIWVAQAINNVDKLFVSRLR
jgi:hypothetical protein